MNELYLFLLKSFTFIYEKSDTKTPPIRVGGKGLGKSYICFGGVISVLGYSFPDSKRRAAPRVLVAVASLSRKAVSWN